MARIRSIDIKSILPITLSACVIAICTFALVACVNTGFAALEPQDMSASWAPSSTRVAFVCYRRQATKDRDVDVPYLGPYSGLDAYTLLEICVSDIDGSNRRQLTDNMISDANPVWSPVGDRIAFVSRRSDSQKADVYAMSSDGTGLVNLTNHPAGYGQLRWSPDGSAIAFISTRDNINGDIYRMTVADGQITRLTKMGWISDLGWSPDGGFIVFEGGSSSSKEIFVVDAKDGSTIQVTDNQVLDFEPVWSPDGRQIAFSSNRKDGVQVYVMDIQTRKVVQMTDDTEPASHASWSPNGQFVSYISGSTNQVLHILNLETGNRMSYANFEAVDKMLWSPDSQYLIYERLEDWNGDGFQETKLWILQLNDGSQWAVSSDRTK